MYLNGRNVFDPRTSHIVWSHIEKDEENFERMKKCIVSHRKIFQCFYTKCYPEIFVQVEKCGTVLRNEFLMKFKTWKDKKQTPKINQQQSIAESNKDEVYSTQKN